MLEHESQRDDRSAQFDGAGIGVEQRVNGDVVIAQTNPTGAGNFMDDTKREWVRSWLVKAHSDLRSARVMMEFKKGELVFEAKAGKKLDRATDLSLNPSVGQTP